MYSDEPKYYTGVGARNTPLAVCVQMFQGAQYLARHGWILRSGAADGADSSFDSGALEEHGEMEIYLPWTRFNGYQLRYGIETASLPMWPMGLTIAASIHTAWDKCSSAVQRLHGRNIFQVLGLDLETPRQVVVYWAEENNKGEVKGGTRTAVMCARRYGIPTFNLAHNTEELRELLGGYR